MVEQPGLGRDTGATREPAEAFAGRNNAMTGDDDRQRIGPASPADGSGRRSQLYGEFAVAARATEGDSLHGRIDPLLKGRTLRLPREDRIS